MRTDYIASVYIVHAGKVLLIYHRGFDTWLPVGGHVEKGETIEEALMREVLEECGLPVKLLSARCGVLQKNTRECAVPRYIEEYKVNDQLRHLYFIYFGTSRRSDATLLEKEHAAIRWFSKQDITNRKFKMLPTVRHHARAALKTGQGK